MTRRRVCSYLPAGKKVRPGFPVGDDAQAVLIGLRQGGQRLPHAGQVRGPVVVEGGHHAGQQGAGAELSAAHAGRQGLLDDRGDAGGVDDVLDRRQRHAHRRYRARPPSRAMALV